MPLLLLLVLRQGAYGFSPVHITSTKTARHRILVAQFETNNDMEPTDGVVELAEDDPAIANKQPAARFISQGEIDPETLNPDMSDPKQARVIIYIIISLIPVLFLIPLMLGSRDLIPLDALPPVDM